MNNSYFFPKVKTWFQNRRMKLKRHQRDSSWMTERYVVNGVPNTPAAHSQVRVVSCQTMSFQTCMRFFLLMNTRYFESLQFVLVQNNKVPNFTAFYNFFFFLVIFVWNDT